jgi:sugar phosphate isomerase/epimerase
MKIGVSMLYKLAEPFEKMVEAMPETRVKYVEVVDDGYHNLNKKRVAELKNVGASYDVEFTVHSPFGGINIVVQDRVILKATLRRLMESIENAAALGCRLWIFHPGLRTGISSFYPPSEDWVRNSEEISLLVRYAEDHGVKAGLENIMEPFVLKTVEDFRRFYSESGLDVGFVLDVGHANVVGELNNFLRAMPDRLVHVHAHDNFGESDQHLGVGHGNIDWNNFAMAMKNNHFRGIVMVETVGEHVGESVERLRKLLS